MQLNAIGLVCKDIDQTKKFYEQFDLKFQSFGDGNDHWEAKQNGLRLMLDSLALIKKINPSYVEKNMGPIVLCFEFETPEKLNQKFAELNKSGYEIIKEPWDAFWGQRYASLLDPDGNQVDLFSQLSE
jgi:uncharacterized glyoxalase superfamily protein PhnB